MPGGMRTVIRSSPDAPGGRTWSETCGVQLNMADASLGLARSAFFDAVFVLGNAKLRETEPGDKVGAGRAALAQQAG